MIRQFHTPATVREAVGLKRRHRARAAYLAGGTWLNSTESGGPPEHVISLARLGLDDVETKPGRVEIGALCRLQGLIGNRRVPEPFRAALGQVVSRNLREMATLGGLVASRYTHSDVLPMLVALDAKVILTGPGGGRTLRVAEYVTKPPPGLITKVLVPRPGASQVAACRAFRTSGNGRSVVSAAVAATVRRGVLQDPIVALGGVARSVLRLPSVEKALVRKPLPSLDEIQELASRAVHPRDGLEGSAVFLQYEAGAVLALTIRDALAGKGVRP